MPLFQIKQKRPPHKRIAIIIASVFVVVAGIGTGAVVSGAYKPYMAAPKPTKQSITAAATVESATEPTGASSLQQAAATTPQKPSESTSPAATSNAQASTRGNAPGESVTRAAAGLNSDALYADTNTNRAEAGLAGLTRNAKLEASACAKVDDMIAKDYFAHTSPSGQQPWELMSAAGYSYRKAGENIAAGQPSGSAVIQAWMDSPGHKANILGAFTEVGMCMKSASGYRGGNYKTVTVAHYATPR